MMLNEYELILLCYTDQTILNNTIHLMIMYILRHRLREIQSTNN